MLEIFAAFIILSAIIAVLARKYQDIVVPVIFAFTALSLALVLAICSPIPAATTPGSDAIAIFLNNLAFAVITLIPVVGWVYALWAMWTCGSKLAAVAGKGLPTVQLLFSYPHVWLELFSYAFFIAASLLFVQGKKKHGLIAVAYGVVLLLLAALFEAS